jgi:hypothetical protein
MENIEFKEGGPAEVHMGWVTARWILSREPDPWWIEASGYAWPRLVDIIGSGS